MDRIIARGLAVLSAVGLFITAPLNVNATKAASEKQGELPRTVTVCGTPLGMRLKSRGLLVTGYNSFLTGEDEYVNPAKTAGVLIGDRIMEINGNAVSKAEDMTAAVEEIGGGECELLLERGDEEISVKVLPCREAGSSEFKLGVWVKDSGAGIGTLTFYEEKTGFFGALGHGISDSVTHELFKTNEGELFPAVLTGVRRGASGYPGELKGYFYEDAGTMGLITANTENGVYGFINGLAAEKVGGREMNVDLDKSVHAGDATIISSVNGDGPKEYTVHIDLVNLKDSGNKGIALHITDTDLLEETGGIVQGMSGSPIIQDGEFVGAVTHVLVNDPSKGYGICAVNMLSQMDEAQAKGNTPKLLPYDVEDERGKKNAA